MATATPDRPPFPLPRGKLTGGSSSVNGQVFFRGIPEDYDEWAELGSPEWAFVNVLPYFRKSETDLTFGADDFHAAKAQYPSAAIPKTSLCPCRAVSGKPALPPDTRRLSIRTTPRQRASVRVRSTTLTG